MDYFKKFGLRLLRLLWAISVIIITLAIGVYLASNKSLNLENITSAITGVMFLIFLLLGIQYLFFGSFKLSYLFEQNTKKLIKNTLLSVLIIFVSCLGVRYWNSYQYNQKLIVGSDPEIFDSLITEIALDRGADHCYDDLPMVKKSDVRIALAEMDKQNLQGLNKVRRLAERNDQIGLNVRCGVYTNKLNSKQMAEIFDIKY